MGWWWGWVAWYGEDGRGGRSVFRVLDKTTRLFSRLSDQIEGKQRRVRLGKSGNMDDIRVSNSSRHERKASAGTAGSQQRPACVRIRRRDGRHRARQIWSTGTRRGRRKKLVLSSSRYGVIRILRQDFQKEMRYFILILSLDGIPFVSFDGPLSH